MNYYLPEKNTFVLTSSKKAFLFDNQTERPWLTLARKNVEALSSGPKVIVVNNSVLARKDQSEWLSYLESSGIERLAEKEEEVQN